MVIVLLSNLGERRRLEMQITLDVQAERPRRLLQFGQRKVTEFEFLAGHCSEECVLAIKFESKPSPATIRGKKIAGGSRIFLQWLLPFSYRLLSSHPLMEDRFAYCLVE